MSATYPKGLLSFLYNVVYDVQLNQQFHDEPRETMDFFGLSASVQQAIQAYDQSRLDDLLQALKEELIADRAKVW